MTIEKVGESYVFDGLEFKVTEMYEHQGETWVVLKHEETRTTKRKLLSDLNKPGKSMPPLSTGGRH